MAPNSLNSHNGAGRTVLSPPASSSVDYCCYKAMLIIYRVCLEKAPWVTKSC